MFDAHYPRRKDWRRPYRRGSQMLDRSCRPGGSCPWCQDNRLYGSRHRLPVPDEDDLAMLSSSNAWRLTKDLNVPRKYHVR